MEKHLVNWKMPRVHVFYTIPAKTDPKGNFIVNAANDGIRMLPGINEYTDAQFKAFCDTDDFKRFIEDDEAVVIDLKEPAKPTLSNFDNKKAIKIVKDTVNFKLLEEWLVKETRGDVLKAINDQMKKLELPPVIEDKEGKQED